MILYLLFIHEKYLYLFIFISSKGCFLQCCAFFTVWNICQNWPIFKFRCKKSTPNMNKGRGENKLCSDYFGTTSVLHFWKTNTNTHTKKRFLECMIALVCVLQRVFHFIFLNHGTVSYDIFPGGEQQDETTGFLSWTGKRRQVVLSVKSGCHVGLIKGMTNKIE